MLKEEAAVLHAKDPVHYPDPNHKPEMAIALTDFELLCGFRPAKEIYENLKGIALYDLLDDHSIIPSNLYVAIVGLIIELFFPAFRSSRGSWIGWWK